MDISQRDAARHNGAAPAKEGGGGVALPKLDHTIAWVRSQHALTPGFSFDEGMDIGVDLATPVTEEYAMGDNAFTGTIRSVTIAVGQDDVSHKLDPELVLNGLMAGQ